MKKIIFSILFLMTYSFANSQIVMEVIDSVTTVKTFDAKKFKRCNTLSDEEYNYMAKGYWSQVENGLDMKKGYEIENTDGYELSNSSYSFTFFPLLKINADKTKCLVGYIIKAHSSVSGGNYHYAMPVNNDGVMISKTFEAIHALDYSMTFSFFKCYVKFMNGCSY